MSLPVAILAGGLAVRLRPITEEIPKALVEVAGEPFAYHQLRLLAGQGIRRVVFCVSYRGQQIVEAVGDGRRFGLQAEYVYDGPALLGTGGALVNALPSLGEAFFVLYGDSYLVCDYPAVAATFQAAKCPALMTVLRNEERWDTSNVEYDGGRLITYSKTNKTPRMRHIDYGLGVFSRAVFADQPPGVAFDLADVYASLAERGMLAAYEVHQRFYEVGSHSGIEDLAKYLKGTKMTFSDHHLREVAAIVGQLDVAAIERLVSALATLRERGGRLFFLGVGGGAGNCSHAVNDFRKIVGIESYAPTDNVSELTARTNDEGWETVFAEWLKVSRLGSKDAIFVMSVGGGNLEKNISPNLVRALEHAKSVGATVMGIVGRDGGYTAKVGDAVVVVPTVNAEAITPHTEAFQAVIWHLLVSHPALKAKQTKWEGAVR
jgi:D-sedoheptulose 7-phosphate isomerase